MPEVGRIPPGAGASESPNLTQATLGTDDPSLYLHRKVVCLTELGQVPPKKGFPGGASGKEPTCQCRILKRHWFDSWVRKIPWRGAWQPTPVILPGKPHRERSLGGYSP